MVDPTLSPLAHALASSPAALDSTTRELASSLDRLAATLDEKFWFTTHGPSDTLQAQFLACPADDAGMDHSGVLANAGPTRAGKPADDDVLANLVTTDTEWRL